MSDKVDLKPVKIRDNGEARVAYDLMLVIAQAEGNTLTSDDVRIAQRTENPRGYYLNLYRKCITLIRTGE